MTVVGILVSVALLVLGRKLFWLFVGAVGFVAGALLATRLLGGRSEWVILLVALGAGILGALLAVFVQKLAVRIAGFVAGGYIAASLVEALGVQLGGPKWLAFVIGGVVGLVLVGVLFEWALIALSSLTGATSITQAVDVPTAYSVLLFLVLLVAGFGIQVAMMYRERRHARRT